jgi:aquaporin Z
MANSKATSKKSTASKAKTKTVEATATKNSMAWYSNWTGAVSNKPIVASVVAEFIGAFLLTAAFLEMQSSPLFVAFALAGVVFIVGGVSGAHVNPAVTIGAWVTGKVKSLTALCFIAAQFLGAGAAWLVLKAFMDKYVAVTDGASSTLFRVGDIPTGSGKEWYLFFAELLGTIILTLGVAIAIRSRHNRTKAAFTQGFAALIALYVTMSLSTVLLAASYSGLTFLNPAIAFAANGLVWGWPVVLYLVAPVIGGIIGFVLRDILYPRNDECDCDACAK